MITAFYIFSFNYPFIQRYLKKYSFKSAITQNLWDSIQDELNASGVTNFNVTELFQPWVSQKGITRVTSSKSSNSLSLNQKRYPDFSNEDYLWPVPITINTEGETPGNDRVQKVLKNREDLFSPENLGDWYSLNSKSAAYYRTLYSKDDEDKLLQNLESNINSVDSLNRWIIMDDNLQRYLRDEIKEVEAFRFSKFLRNEESAGPWNVFADTFRNTYNKIADLSSETALRDYTRYISDNIFNKVTFEPSNGEAQLTTLTREIVSGFSCSFGNDECIDKAVELSQKYLEDSDNNP